MGTAVLLDTRTSLIRELRRQAEAEDVYAIFRLEDRRSRSISFEGTRVDSVVSAKSTGIGIQAFTRSGHNGFAAIDDPDPERAALALARATASAKAAERAGLEANPAVLSVPASHGRSVPETSNAFDSLTIGEIRERVAAVCREIAAVSAGTIALTTFAIAETDWRIARTDGTDVVFRIPRAQMAASLTCRNGQAVRTSASVTGTSYELLLDSGIRDRFVSRVSAAADLARDLLHAPPYPPGSYRLLIDFALAKGLAHEAFGHAAESDGLDASILGAAGRFRAGERFGSQALSIVDESLSGDNAFQPFSGNGVPRERTLILDRGVLRDALTDVHTAGRAGTRLTGAGRVQSFANVPVPRMSNIRIEMDDAYPVPEGRDFYEWTPEGIRDLMVEAGELGEEDSIVFLSGYRGGQVNPALGDFVFNSTALYELRRGGVRLFKPGIFSGRIDAALHSIRRAFGPLRLDAAGTCGKAGQSVPSSGGSHHFLLLDEDPQVRIGGRQ